jgi:hypothetical protein
MRDPPQDRGDLLGEHRRHREPLQSGASLLPRGASYKVRRNGLRHQVLAGVCDSQDAD